MKRVCILLGLLPALFAIGCTGGSQESAEKPSASTSNESGEFKVALLTPGPVSDAGWSAMAFEGLQEIESQMGATIANQEAAGTKVRDAMRSYAREGFDLVFGHGFEYNKPGVELAAEFPNTVFVSSSGGETATNAGAFRFYLEQSCYLAGIMAARMSKTGTLGMVAGPEVPSIASTLKAFAAGAKSVNPNIKIVQVYFGDSPDPAKARQATLSVIDQGADFVIHQANAAVQGVFDACKDRGVKAFGTNLNQNDNASGAVVASAIIVPGPAFVNLAKLVQSGEFKGDIVLMGMQEGAIDFVLNPAFESQVPAEVKEEIEATKAKILSGELVVPKDEF